MPNLTPFSFGFDRALDLLYDTSPSLTLEEEELNKKVEPNHGLSNYQTLFCKMIVMRNNDLKKLGKIPLEPTCKELCMMKAISNIHCN